MFPTKGSGSSEGGRVGRSRRARSKKKKKRRKGGKPETLQTHPQGLNEHLRRVYGMQVGGTYEQTARRILDNSGNEDIQLKRGQGIQRGNTRDKHRANDIREKVGQGNDIALASNNNTFKSTKCQHTFDTLGGGRKS